MCCVVLYQCLGLVASASVHSPSVLCLASALSLFPCALSPAQWHFYTTHPSSFAVLHGPQFFCVITASLSLTFISCGRQLTLFRRRASAPKPPLKSASISIKLRFLFHFPFFFFFCLFLSTSISFYSSFPLHSEHCGIYKRHPLLSNHHLSSETPPPFSCLLPSPFGSSFFVLVLSLRLSPASKLLLLSHKQLAFLNTTSVKNTRKKKRKV